RDRAVSGSPRSGPRSRARERLVARHRRPLDDRRADRTMRRCALARRDATPGLRRGGGLTRGVGSDTNPRDGDRVKIEVDLEGGLVMTARVSGSGCEVSTKAPAALVRLVRGRARSEALAIGVEGVVGQIGPVGE